MSARGARRSVSAWPAITSLAFALLLACGRARAADEIHWTMISPTSVTFDWRGANPTLQYGQTNGYGSTATGIPPVPMPFSSPGPFWEARVDGLEPNRTYHYSIDGGPDHTFHTLPRPGRPFTVYVEGDVGDSVKYPAVAPVQGLIAAGEPSFVLVVGDLTYGHEDGLAAVDRHFDDVMPWSQDAAYMPAWGNHDWALTDSTDNLRDYTGRFELPNPQTSPGAPAVSCCGEDWYWFDAGTVRFIAYPEPYTGAWPDWHARAATLMDQAQADPAIRFIVTFGHRAAYSSGFHPGLVQLRSILDSLGARHDKYVLNVNGHSHNYERTLPQFGVTHVTAGIGGSLLEARKDTCLWVGGCPPPSWSAFRAFHYGALRLEFGPHTIRGEAKCGPPGSPSDIACGLGESFDSFTIGHDAAPVLAGAPASVTDTAGRPVVVDVRVSDPDDDPIDSLTADLSRLPANNDAVFVPGSDNVSGQLRWTPAASDTGTYVVVFRAANALAASISTVIDVRGAPLPPPPPPRFLALDPVRPNPAGSSFSVGCWLTGRGTARLDLVDVAGRLLRRIDLGQPGAGHYVASIRMPGSLSAGLYWLRLEEAGRTVFGRVVFRP